MSLFASYAIAGDLLPESSPSPSSVLSASRSSADMDSKVSIRAESPRSTLARSPDRSDQQEVAANDDQHAMMMDAVAVACSVHAFADIVSDNHFFQDMPLFVRSSPCLEPRMLRHCIIPSKSNPHQKQA